MGKIIVVLIILSLYILLFFFIYKEQKKIRFCESLPDKSPLKGYAKEDLLYSLKRGDSDPSAYLIVITGLVLSFLLDKYWLVYVTAIVLFTYQVGIDVPPKELAEDIGLDGESQFSRGFARVFMAFFASIVPFIVGLLIYWVLNSVWR